MNTQGKKTVYFSADQELSNPIFKDAQLFVRFIKDQFLRDADGIAYIFIDEFQYIPQAGLFLKQIFDAQKDTVQLIVSGSSSLEIAKNTEYLTGRKISFHLHPFSFLEYLAARSSVHYAFSWHASEPLVKLEEFVRVYEYDLKARLEEYLVWGGYPEAVVTTDAVKRSAILKEIVSTYIQKDVAGFLRVENVSGFNNLAAVLASQVGNLLNKHEIGNTLNLNAKTVDKYLDILEGTFVFTRIRPMHSNLRKTLLKTPKIYAKDLGIVRTVLREETPFSEELFPESRVENFIYNELSRRYDEDPIFFYRTTAGAEVDFVIPSGASGAVIEVKWRKGVQKPERVMREVRAEIVGQGETAVIVSRDDLHVADDGTTVVPAYVFPFVRWGNMK